MTAEEKPQGTRRGDGQSKTVLYFDGYRRYGLVKAGGVSIEIDEIPAALALPKATTNVSFYDESHDYRLKEATEAPRDMRPPEIEAIQTFLASIADFGRRMRKSWRKTA